MRKSIKKIIIILIFIIIEMFFVGNNVFANNKLFTKAEYSNEFKEWLKLSEEERKNVNMPRMYEIENTKIKITNPINIATFVRASNTTRYNLKDIIPNNLVIKNQGITNSCWAFAALSSLETNLALFNYNRGINLSKVYDFSERHMEYATSNVFLNNEKNEKGYNRKVGAGGSYQMATSYLTSGMGAIEETQMPFENNENIINLSSIQNKNTVTQVYDTVLFEDYGKANDEKKIEIINKIKKHIQNYGSVQANIHGAMTSLLGDCYNNNTGAKFCNNEISHPYDHAVSIIGWDDNYSINNFPESCRPQKDGAWIVRNSWGEKIEISTVQELKKELFNQYKEECIKAGWDTAEKIPNEFIVEAGFILENDKVYQKYGDNGIIYISYEDVNVSKEMFGIIKASDTVNYDNLYQYDEFFPVLQLFMKNPKVMLCNIFDKKTSGKEYLTDISLYASETWTCRVYVNPNGSSKEKKDLQLVPLKAGESETFDAGYHTIEFAKPIEIKGDSFAVVVEVTGHKENLMLPIECKVSEVNAWDNVTVQNGKCFAAVGHDLNNLQWQDLGKLSQENPDLSDGDNPIKAFTINQNYDGALDKIEIIQLPIKTKYFEGENFDKTGMQIKAYYRRKDNPTVILKDSEYSIENGNKLIFGQESVIIKYQDQSIKQNIIVEKNELIDLKIKIPPTKTEYKEGQNFDKAGMLIEGQYKNSELKTISDYEVKNGNNLKYNQEEVIITFEGKEVRQKINVLPNPLIEIKLKTEANKTEYVVGQDFDKTGMVVIGKYEDGTIQEILDYEIKNGTDLKIDQKYVIIEYSGKTAEQTITVKEKQVTKISINKLPTKNEYIQYKEELDLTGGSLKVEYNDNSSEILDLKSKDVKISGFSKEKIGKQTIKVEYGGQITSFEIKIIEEEKAENSNFDNAKCEVTGVKGYIFTEDNGEEYLIMNIVTSPIEKNLKNDSYEYYYSISSNKNDNNIKYWVKLDDKQIENKNLEFQINTKDLKNFDELQDVDTIYLYIKEVVKKGSNQSVKISKSMEMNFEGDFEIEFYINNVKIVDDMMFDKDDEEYDETIANQKIPAAGIRTMFILIVVVVFVGIIKYIKYRKISKYID